MPKLAEKYDLRNPYGYNNTAKLMPKRPYPAVPRRTVREAQPRYVRPERKPVSRKAQKNYFIHRIISILFLSALAMFIFPFTYNRVIKSFFYKSPYPAVKTDYQKLLTPTSEYLHNDLFLDQYSLKGAETKKPQMLALNMNERLSNLENQLENLSSLYPSIEPSVFVWDYETGNYAGVNSDKIYSAASIIKIPVLIQLFRSIEAGQLTIYDTTTAQKAPEASSLRPKIQSGQLTIWRGL